MLFLFKYIDDLIGKGFQWYTILELMWYASATNVAMALPLAMLLSSIMTFGSLGENYELVAIKAAGISLQKAMRPLFVMVGMLSIAAFLFSEYMLPVANLKFGSMLWDVTNQKALPMIQEGVFNNSFPGYTLRAEKKDPDGQTLHNIIIYDHENGSNGNVDVVIAKRAKMTQTPDELVLILKDGVRYSEQSGEGGVYDPRQQLTRFRFKESEQKFDLSDFKQVRTDENLFKSNYAMMNLRQLRYYRDSTIKVSDSLSSTYASMIIPYFRLYSLNLPVSKTPVSKVPAYKETVLEIIPEADRVTAISYAQSEISTIKETLSVKAVEKVDYIKSIYRSIIEYHRKFTMAFSCLVLFSIGAPLGAIIRKGGLGLPVVMSILFFLIYHIISTIGEKSAKAGTMDPILGMWIAIIFLTPLGIFLTYKAATDSAIFDIEYYKQRFLKFFSKKK